jgi:hypothetical protein
VTGKKCGQPSVLIEVPCDLAEGHLGECLPPGSFKLTDRIELSPNIDYTGWDLVAAISPVGKVLIEIGSSCCDNEYIWLPPEGARALRDWLNENVP